MYLGYCDPATMDDAGLGSGVYPCPALAGLGSSPERDAYMADLARERLPGAQRRLQRQEERAARRRERLIERGYTPEEAASGGKKGRPSDSLLRARVRVRKYEDAIARGGGTAPASSAPIVPIGPAAPIVPIAYVPEPGSMLIDLPSPMPGPGVSVPPGGAPPGSAPVSAAPPNAIVRHAPIPLYLDDDSGDGWGIFDAAPSRAVFAPAPRGGAAGGAAAAITFSRGIPLRPAWLDSGGAPNGLGSWLSRTFRSVTGTRLSDAIGPIASAIPVVGPVVGPIVGAVASGLSNRGRGGRGGQVIRTPGIVAEGTTLPVQRPVSEPADRNTMLLLGILAIALVTLRR